jgi:2-oxoglutarate ferredoxin oxidoreductase subunit beta
MSVSVNPKANPNRKFLREEKLPHFFCSGCGCGQVLNYFTQALNALQMDVEKMLTIGGVGCTARMPVYLKSDTFHGVHGRTLAWATGVKMHQPEIPIVIFAGDGDLVSIGGNHFIHAARRNLDVTVIMVNNLNFAMTGGQVAPTTPLGSVTMTTPYGNDEPAFDVAQLAMAAGATHVERWTTSRPIQCEQAIKRALQHKGFSLIEIVSQCPTHFGRYALKSGDPGKLLQWIHQNSYLLEQADRLTDEEKQNKLACGIFKFSEGARPLAQKFRDGARPLCEKKEEIYSETPAAGNHVSTLPYPQRLTLCGMGGQGIILASVLLGTAAVTLAGLHAVQTQSYGSEARGGQCQAELIIDRDPILSPVAQKKDLLLAMFSEAYHKYIPDLKTDGVLVYDTDLVQPEPRQGKSYGVPATQMAVNLGNRMAANMVMLGFLAEMFGIISVEALEQVVISEVDERFRELDINAVRAGVGFAQQIKMHERGEA